MKQSNRYDSLDPSAVRFVRHHARRLVQSNVKAAWDVEDYEQDLILDLLIRSRRFDESRSSYATFADRVVRRRVATLFAEGASDREWPTTMPLDERTGVSDVDALWPVSALPLWEREHLTIDLGSFLKRLPDRFRDCCDWLSAENRRAFAAALGRHRSSMYDAATELRRRATDVGLHHYL